MRYLLLFVLLLTGCAGSDEAIAPRPDATPPVDAVLQALQRHDWQQLADYVHVDRGLRFTPYGFVSDADRHFTREQVRRLAYDGQAYQWGYYPGSGEPLLLTVATYWAQFIWDRDWRNAPQQATDIRLGFGTTADNARAYHGGATVYECHYPGSGSSWASLRLAFRHLDTRWWLVGIIHDRPLE